MRVSLHLTLISFLASFASAFSTVTPRPTSAARLFPALLPRCDFLDHGACRRSLAVRGGGLLRSNSPTTPLAGTKKKLSATAGASSGRTSPIDTGSKCPVTGLVSVLSSAYGTGGVIYILLKAIKRVLPVALEPFQKSSVTLSQFELGAYVATCLWFAYVEGYKGFQLKFSPMVVKRSFTLIPGKNGTRWYHFFLAPLYSMGLFHATNRRKAVSWGVSIGIAMVVAAVKRLPYPWRNVVDAGVVAGLSWGSVSLLILYVRTWVTGQTPQHVDAALPPTSPSSSSSAK